MSLGKSHSKLIRAQFLKTAQRIMSSTASNYDVSKLQQGVFVAIVSNLTIACAAISVLLPSRGTLIKIIALCSTYGAMMFASSFVEEEHHFWYWSTSGWIASIWAKRSVSTMILSQLCPDFSQRTKNWLQNPSTRCSLRHSARCVQARAPLEPDRTKIRGSS